MKTSSQQLIITGTQVVIKPDETVPRSTNESVDYIPENLIGFGFTDLVAYDPATKTTTALSQDPDKFIAYAENLATARSEFWGRWKQYVLTRFNRSFVTIIEP
jgi:hypothetical protein